MRLLRDGIVCFMGLYGLVLVFALPRKPDRIIVICLLLSDMAALRSIRFLRFFVKVGLSSSTFFLSWLMTLELQYGQSLLYLKRLKRRVAEAGEPLRHNLNLALHVVVRGGACNGDRLTSSWRKHVPHTDVT